MISLAGAVRDAYAPNVDVEIIYKGDLTEMPMPPNMAVDDRVLGKEVTAEKLEEIIVQLLLK